MLIALSLLSLSFELLASFWCPCTILPHFVIESGPKAFMETEKLQLFTRFQFPSYVSFKSKLQYPKCPTHPTFFVKGKFYNRDFLPLEQISAGKTWHFRFKFPTPARQRHKFPSPWTRTTVKRQWVSRETLRWEIVLNCF